MRIRSALLAAAAAASVGATACQQVASTPPAQAPAPPSAPTTWTGLSLGGGLRGLMAVGNDAIEDATDIAGLPFTVTGADLTGATSDAGLDPNNACYFGGDPGKTVWYHFRPTEDQIVYVDQVGSVVEGNQADPVLGNQIGLLAFAGTLDDVPASLANVACGWPRLTFQASAGTDYYIAAVAPTAATRADLSLLVRRFVPLEYSLTIDQVGAFVPGTKRASISGTFTTNKAAVANFWFRLKQQAGHISIQGTGNPAIETTGAGTIRWTSEVFWATGYWAGGQAQLEFLTDFNPPFVSDPEGCCYHVPLVLADRTIRLKAARK